MIQIRPAPHGAGGLKLLFILLLVVRWCPAPHGAGGLKLVLLTLLWGLLLSRPARGGWIEIDLGRYEILRYGPAPHGAGGLK